MQSNKSIILLMLFTLIVLGPIVFLRRLGSKSDASGVSIPVSLLVRAEKKVYRMGLEEYLLGVVAAEMPAEFSMEALKAQAVAARTLAVRRLKKYGGQGTKYYPQADFSDDPNESQAWLSWKNLQMKWGFWECRKYYQKIRKAVVKTAGIIMVYNNRPIDAVFHSTCGGGTESARAVWNYDIPYLRSVECKYDKHSPRYHHHYFFTWLEVAKQLKISEKAASEITIVRHTSSGRVSEISCGAFRVSGKEFRRRLNLPSNYFTMKKTASGVQLMVTGYGHGVGMCQYGADGLAKQGWNYRQILGHYYQGVKFLKIKY